jgi:hypothetical protein
MEPPGTARYYPLNKAYEFSGFSHAKRTCIQVKISGGNAERRNGLVLIRLKR